MFKFLRVIKRNHLDTPIYIYSIVRLFKWFLFRKIKVEQLQLLYIKTSIVVIYVQILKMPVNKLIIWPTALPNGMFAVAHIPCLEIKKCIYDMMVRRIQSLI